MLMLDPIRAVVPVTTGEKGRLSMSCHSLKMGPSRSQRHQNGVQRQRHAPQGRRGVSHMLRVQARARQRRGCIRSPVVIRERERPPSERLLIIPYLVRSRRTYGTPDNIRKCSERFRTNWSGRERSKKNLGEGTGRKEGRVVRNVKRWCRDMEY